MNHLHVKLFKFTFHKQISYFRNNWMETAMVMRMGTVDTVHLHMAIQLQQRPPTEVS